MSRPHQTMTKQMRIRLLDQVDGYSWAIGTEITVDVGEARVLIEQGKAEPVASRPFDRAEKRRET